MPERLRKRIGYELYATSLFMKLHGSAFGIDTQLLMWLSMPSEFDAFSVSIMDQIHRQLHTAIDVAVFSDVRNGSEALQIASVKDLLAEQILSDFVDLQFEFFECTYELDKRGFVDNSLYLIQPTTGGPQIDFLPPG